MIFLIIFLEIFSVLKNIINKIFFLIYEYIIYEYIIVNKIFNNVYILYKIILYKMILSIDKDFIETKDENINSLVKQFQNISDFKNLNRDVNNLFNSYSNININNLLFMSVSNKVDYRIINVLQTKSGKPTDFSKIKKNYSLEEYYNMYIHTFTYNKYIFPLLEYILGSLKLEKHAEIMINDEKYNLLDITLERGIFKWIKEIIDNIVNTNFKFSYKLLNMFVA